MTFSATKYRISKNRVQILEHLYLNKYENLLTFSEKKDS